MNSDSMDSTGNSRRSFVLSALTAASAVALPRRAWTATATGVGKGPAFKEVFVSRGENRLYVREWPGDGPAFVMLHGFPDNLHIYDAVAPLLAAAGRHVVTFDFMGFGASDKPKGYKYGFEQQLGDMGAVVDGLGLQSVIPVAHDAGGPCAINFALDRPTRVSSMILLNTFYQDSTTTHFPELITLFSDPALHELALSFLSDPVKMKGLLQFQNKQFLVNANEDQKSIFNNILQPSIDANFAGGAGPAFIQMTSDLRPSVKYNTSRLPELARFEPPVRAIFGSGDPYLSPSVGKDLVTRFKHGSLQAVGGGHWPQLDNAQEVASAMLAWTRG